MKKCPTCDKTFDNNLRFCQTDGTPLVEATAETAIEDPYKTMVASKDEMAAALPLDPFKTMVGGMPMKDEEEEVLELPDKSEPLKTPIISQEDIKTQIKRSEPSSAKDAPPPSPFGNPPPTYPPIKSPGDFTAAPPAPPKFNEPSFGDVSSEASSGDKDSAPPYKPASQSPFAINPVTIAAIPGTINQQQTILRIPKTSETIANV